jgi:hypothetical protein
MKRCPTCQRTYPDDAPAFCVNDGTKLVDEAAPQEYDPQKTILSSVPMPPPSSPPPPQQYSSPAPPPVQSPTQQPPPQQQQQPQQPYQPQQQQQPVWPPQPQAQAPPQGQNWGSYQQPAQYPNYPQQQYAPPASGGKAFTLTTLILGVISALALALVFAMANGVIAPDLDVLQIAYYGSLATGVIALILGILSMISRRQRSKWMAIVGMVLGLPGILFFIYVQFIR